MGNDREDRLRNINSATLKPIVSSALGNDAIEVTEWNCVALKGGYGEGSSIYRFHGTGLDEGHELTWSLILKVLQRGDRVDDPSHYRYWKREYLVFESGLLDRVTGNLHTPKCLGISEPSDDECWIWLEDIANDVGPIWPLSQFGPVARHLGQFNGAYLSGEPMPSEPWLSVGWLRELISNSESGIDLLRDSLTHPLVSRWYTETVARDTIRLWEEREMYLDALDHLPQTFCHRDANWRNLFYRKSSKGKAKTIAVDWQETGQGAIGEEIVGLTCSSIVFEQIDVAQAPRLDRIVFENYLLGLRDAGWQGDFRIVRFGFAAASALHYSFKALKFLLETVLDEKKHHTWCRCPHC